MLMSIYLIQYIVIFEYMTARYKFRNIYNNICDYFLPVSVGFQFLMDHRHNGNAA